MQNIWKGLRRFLADEEGPTAVEYSVMLAFIILVCVTAISAVGSRVNAIYGDMDSKL